MKRIWTILALIAVLAVVVPASAQGPQGEVNVYIAIMALDPAIAYEGGVQGMTATRPEIGGKIDPNSAQVRAYTDFLKQGHDATLKAVGADESDKIYSYTYGLNGFAARLSEEQAADLAKQPGVVLVIRDQMRYKTTDSSPTFLGLTGRGGAWARGLTGEGVVVGIIDTGIWPEHPSFADDGSYPTLPIGPFPCEFGNTAWNPNDAPFTCNDKLIGARQMLDTYRAVTGADPDEYDSARDDDGHGTHTASTAAGNAGVKASIFGIPRGTISGIAPRARIIAYKGLGNLGGYTSDLAAAIDQAVADGVDVINYSIGGGAAAPGADDIAFLFAADAGVYVATSAGNDGPDPATLGNPGTMPWITTVGASTQPRFFRGTVVLGDLRQSKYYGASITDGTGKKRLPLVDAEFAGGDLCVPGTLDSNKVAGKIVLCRRGAVDRAAKSLAVYQAGGAGMIMYNNTNDDNLHTDNHWVPSVHIDNTPGLAIKAYIASAANPTAQIIGGKRALWKPAPSMTIFSSRGPNPVAGDIIKPDVTAPGIQILAGNSPTPDPNSTPPGELFQAIAGTSMSSPHVAGAFALIKQAHPDWSAAMAKSALMTSAYQKVWDNDRVSMADPFDFGAGHITLGPRSDDRDDDDDDNGRSLKNTAFDPGLVYDARYDDYLGFLCDAFPEVFVDPEGTCASLEDDGISTDASDLNYPSIGIAELAGTQTVQRTMTAVFSHRFDFDDAVSYRGKDRTITFRPQVKAPPGYDVTVSPNRLKLKNGESATYHVTITNNGGGPIGEWRFGSLTWKGDGYNVYSPIAVRGALFDAPAEISGSGEDGAASFDVKFGYTGPYAAAGHGLVPATVTSDNVLQDGDQTFDPADVAAGGANLHVFTLSGAAYFRIAMPPEATEANADLDIFVYDPSNTLFASSTSGGTNELIDILLPADGTWSVYVHGWSAPGGDSDYNMWAWTVPLATGGSLSLAAAPTSATIGTIGTIDISWSGLTTGAVSDWYLGAVSHTGDAGLMGLTLVNVDNR